MLESRLKQLSDQYLLRSREELALLRAQLPLAQLGRADALLEVQRYAHRIAGSGALLGFKAISDAMALVERTLRRAESAPSEAEWQVIQQQLLLVDAELALQSHADDPP